MSKKEKSFEESLKRLEEIIDIIDNKDITLDESLKVYSEGMELTMKCIDKLNDVEKEVKVLTQNLEDKFETKTFKKKE